MTILLKIYIVNRMLCANIFRIVYGDGGLYMNTNVIGHTMQDFAVAAAQWLQCDQTLFSL